MNNAPFRLSAIGSVFETFKSAVEEANMNAEQAENEGYKGFNWEDFEIICEEIYGASFVIAQSYIRSEFNIISNKANKDIGAHWQKYLHFKSPLILGANISRLELIIAVANCYKHREEWGKQWETSDSKAMTTIETLKLVNITVQDPFPSVSAVHALRKMDDWDFFEDLFEDLSNWHSFLLSLAKKD